MDEIDLQLLRSLFENSRLTYKELAEQTKVSVSAVHKRIKKLEDENVITEYIARPSLFALNYLGIAIFGTATVRSIEETSSLLGQHENIICVAVAGAKYLVISAVIRNISELQELGSFCQKTAKMENPTIAIVKEPDIGSFPEALTGIDYKILKSLNLDAKKPVIDIADEVGLSPKTVKKHLDHMTNNNLATFTIEFSPLYRESFVTLFHLVLNEGMDIESTVESLIKKYMSNLVICVSFSNIPNMIMLEVLTTTARDSQKIEKELHLEGFKDVIPYVFREIRWYKCWIDQFLKAK